MRVAIVQRNLLAAGSVETDQRAFTRGLPAANLVDPDPDRYAEWRGTQVVTAGADDTIAGNDGSPFTATLAPGVYYSPTEYAIEAARALNAVSSNWTGSQLQGEANRHRIRLARTSGTASLDPTTATSSLSRHGGFGPYARAAAAAHVGDFAACCYPYDSVLFDLGSAQVGTASFVARPRTSPGALFEVGLGSTTAASDFTARAGDAHDTACLAVFYGAPQSYRYFDFRIYDQRREEHQRAAVGYLWHGAYYDTDPDGEFGRLEWEYPSYGLDLENRSAMATGKHGHRFFSEVAPGERVSIAWGQSPGLPQATYEGLLGVLLELGVNGLCFLALNPVDEPNRETRLCRLVSMPSVARSVVGSRRGRVAVPLVFEVVA